MSEVRGNYWWSEKLEFTRDPSIPFETKLYTGGLSQEQLQEKSTYTIQDNSLIMDMDEE